jgi:histidinol-phosphatase (PHP family)
MAKKKEIFEVNTGAISRGHRTTPYPAPFILDEMKRLDCKLIISSDCHSKEALDCAFAETTEYVKAHGFDTLYYLSDNGFIGEKI